MDKLAKSVHTHRQSKVPYWTPTKLFCVARCFILASPILNEEGKGSATPTTNALVNAEHVVYLSSVEA